MAAADFKINTSVQADRGFEATTSEAITLQLENAPTADVYSVVFSVEAKSKDAPALTLSPSTGIPSTPGGTVTFTMPGSGFHSYLIRCKVNNGKRRGERGEVVDADFTKKRIIAIRSATADVRKTVPGERTEFHENGWSYALDELAEAFENGAVGGVDTNEPILTDGSAPSLSSARNIQALGSTLAFASTAAIPCSFSRTNAATNTVVDARSLIALSSGTAAAGFGVADLYRAAGASGTAIDYGRIGFACTDITSSSEDTKAVIQVRTGGSALAACVEFSGAGANMLGGAITACTSVSNAGGGLSLTAGGGAASLAGSTTATVSANGGLLTLEAATDVSIEAITGDVTVDAAGDIDVAGTDVYLSGVADGTAGFVAIAADGKLSRGAGGSGASATEHYLVDAASTTLANGVPLQALVGGLTFDCASDTPVLLRRRDTSSTGTLDALTISRTRTGGGGAVGIGTGAQWQVYDADETAVEGARIAAVATDVTSGSHAAKLVFQAATAGELANVGEWEDTGALSVYRAGSSNNTEYALHAWHVPSGGSGAVNTGTGIGLWTRSGSGNAAMIGSVYGYLTDATDGGENSALRFTVLDGGGLTIPLTLSSAGASVDGGVTANGFVGASLDTASAGTLSIAPSNGTAVAIGVATTLTGVFTERQSALTTTVSPGIIAENTTAATSGATVQYGGAVVSRGAGWSSGAGVNAAITSGFYTRPLSAGTAGTEMVFFYGSGVGQEFGRWTTALPSLGGSGLAMGTTILLTSTSNGYRLDQGSSNFGGVKVSSSNVILESQGSSKRVEAWSALGTSDTGDGARVWNNAGTRTAGNLFAVGDGSTWAEKFAVGYDGLLKAMLARPSTLYSTAGPHSVTMGGLVRYDGASAMTFNLPSPTAALAGQWVVFFNEGTGTSNVTIQTPSGTINSASSKVVATGWTMTVLFCTGTNGYVGGTLTVL